MKIQNEPILLAAVAMVALTAEHFLGAKYGFSLPAEVRAALVATIVGALGVSARANLKGPVTAKGEK